MTAPALDPNSFSGLVDSIIAGDSAVGKASFMLPANVDVSGGSVSWCLIDKLGTLYSQGNATDYLVSSTSFNTLVEAHSIITAPSSLPPSSEGHSYQLRWELSLPGSQLPTYSFESLTVTGLTSAPDGPETAIEMHGDRILIGTVTTRLYDTVKFEIYDSFNRRLLTDNIIPVAAPLPVAGGFYYSAEIDPTNISTVGTNPFCSRLEAYIITWKYGMTGSNLVSRQTAELFIVNSSILAAMEDSRRMVMKARTTQFGFPDAVFDDATLISWLRRGRDLFNNAAGVLVEFTMTNATGGIREFWLRYAEVAMLRAQALAEGEKAFNFAGSAIQLDVDKSQYYSALADSIQQQLDNDIKSFKQNLLKKGISVGDGNMTNLAGSNWGASRLGLSVHAATQFGRFSNRRY